VYTKRPRSKSTKATYFSSLALLMAATSGRVAARQQTPAAILAAVAPHGGRKRQFLFPSLALLMAAAGVRMAAGYCRVKERDPLSPPLAFIAQSKAEQKRDGRTGTLSLYGLVPP
jgi:Mrp family chromosome partitioning ATPase